MAGAVQAIDKTPQFFIVRQYEPTHEKPFHRKADVSSEALMRGIREKFLRESHAFDAQDLATLP